MLRYHPNYITKEQEQEILRAIPQFVLRTKEGRNNVYRYGLILPYNSNFVSREIPEIFTKLGISNFDSVTVNEYAQGQFLDFHIDDKLAGEQIVVLSLLGHSEVIFKNQSGDCLKYEIEPRSLYVMEGDLRWNWQHKATAKELRYSVVFRTYTGETKKTIKINE
jgi:alkylated DNA repair dioxygenase AlkB